MKRERFKWKTHKDLSTEAEHRGGPDRSSEEASVMEVERRDPDYPAFTFDQPEVGGVTGKSEAVCDIEVGCMECVQEGESEPRFSRNRRSVNREV
jgi:hypothetical protein